MDRFSTANRISTVWLEHLLVLPRAILLHAARTFVIARLKYGFTISVVTYHV